MKVFDWLKSKCFYCRVPFTGDVHPVDIQTADKQWKQICRSCYKNMGGKPPRKNIVDSKTHNPDQQKLF